MIESAVLFPNTRGRWADRIAGATVLERQLFTLVRAGVQKVWLNGDSPPTDALRKPMGLEILRTPSGSPMTDPHLVVSGDVFFRIETIQSISSYSGSWAMRDEGGEIVLRVVRTGMEEKLVDLPPESCISLRRTNREDILTWLLDGVRKDSDGFMARYFDRNISLGVTRQILDTWIRPNQMTIFSTWIGLIGAAQFFYATRYHEVAGSLLIWLHTVLDGCDGEMARLTFRESSWGSWMDFWGDNLVHVVLFAGLAVDLRQSERWAPVLGVLACIGALGSALGSAWLSAKSRAREQRSQSVSSVMSGVAQIPTDDHGLSERLKKLEMFLAQRDFIYLLVICSLFDHEAIFLWAAGLGAPLYLLILIYLVRHHSKKDPEARSYSSQIMMPKETA